MRLISYDASSGNLKAGVVSEAAWGHFDETERLNLVYAKFAAAKDMRTIPLCFRGANHAARVDVDSLDVDLFGVVMAPIVAVIDHGFTTLSEEFAQRLAGSELTGFRLRDNVRVSANQSSVHAPKLRYFEITGSGGFGRRYRVTGAPNQCPHCGRTSVICVHCGTFSSKCSACGQRTINTEGESDPKLFTFGGLPKTLIVSDRDWDGSDIFGVDGPGGGVFFSARARAWFEKLHIFQVKFKDALIDMS
jgi:hypothetical protein